MVTAETPVVFIGPASGFVGLERTLVSALLSRRQIFIEINISSNQLTGSAYTEELLKEIKRAISDASLERQYGDSSLAHLPAIVGYSLGAQIAAIYAARQPETISSLTLISGWYETSSKMLELQNLIQLLCENNSSPDPTIETTTSRLIRLVLGSTLGWDAGLFGDHMREAAQEMITLVNNCDTVDLQDIVEKITLPALVIGCVFDEFAGISQSRKLFGALTDSRYAEIDSGHLVCSERPVELVSMIEEFLEDPRRHSSGSLLERYRP